LKLKNNSMGKYSTNSEAVIIWKHSIVLPNSAVTKNIPPYSMCRGVPAKFIKSTYEMITNNT